MKHTLPGQLDMPEIDAIGSAIVQRKANSRLIPSKEQKPCDIGLFSDDSAQIDLVEMLMEPVPA